MAAPQARLFGGLSLFSSDPTFVGSERTSERRIANPCQDFFYFASRWPAMGSKSYSVHQALQRPCFCAFCPARLLLSHSVVAERPSLVRMAFQKTNRPHDRHFPTEESACIICKCSTLGSEGDTETNT